MRRLDELSSSDLDEVALRQRLVSAMEVGLSAAQALKRLGLDASGSRKRWAQRVLRAYQETGRLADGRHAPKRREKRVMLKAMEAFVEAQWMHSRGASAEGIRIAVTRKLESLQARIAAGADVSSDPLGIALSRGPVAVPSVQTLYDFFKSLGSDKALIRKLGYAEWVRQNRPITKEVDWATRANEEWQIDHTPLDIWVRVQDKSGLWVAARPFLTAVIDVFSRAIMGVAVSERDPDAFTTAIVLRMAILPKSNKLWTPRGLPERLVLDNGKDFRAHSVAGILSALRILAQFCDPHQPDQKPHIERWLGTLTTQLLPILPGYTQGGERGMAWTPTRVDRLLTIPQLRAEIEWYVTEAYHQRTHGTTGRPPVAMWEESVPQPDVPRTADLDVLLLHTAERCVVRGLIRFAAHGHRALYYVPGLLNSNGRRILIRYNPDDLKSILLYDAQTRERLGEAWDINNPASPYSKADIRTEARATRAEMAAHTQGLLKRLPQYYRTVAESDRLAKRRAGDAYVEARVDAAALLVEHAAGTPTAKESGVGHVRTVDEDEVRKLKAAMRATAQAHREVASAEPLRSTTLPSADPERPVAAGMARLA